MDHEHLPVAWSTNRQPDLGSDHCAAYDRAIQRLFAAGLTIECVGAFVPPAAEGLQDALVQIDLAIRDLEAASLAAQQRAAGSAPAGGGPPDNCVLGRPRGRPVEPDEGAA